MNAQEAKELTIKSNLDIFRKCLEECYARIKAEAENGKNFLYLFVPKNTSWERVMDLLKVDGFTVSYVHDELVQESAFKIEWLDEQKSVWSNG